MIMDCITLLRLYMKIFVWELWLCRFCYM